MHNQYLLLDDIVSLHLAMHFYSTILVVKYSTKLIIHGHFLLLQVAAEPHCITRGNGSAGLSSQRSPWYQGGKLQTPCCVSWTQSQPLSWAFLERKQVFISLPSTGDTKAPGFAEGSFCTSFHLPYLPAFGTWLGPFEKLFYLIKNKLTKN